MSFLHRRRARITTTVPHGTTAAGDGAPAAARQRPITPPRYRRVCLLVLGALAGVAIPCHRANAQCASLLDDGSFEEYRGRGGRWFAEGKAGVDQQKGRSRRGGNNAWADNTTGWNAIKQRVSLTKGNLYTLTVHVKTSSNVTDGYFGFRDSGHHPVAEIKFAAQPAYKEMRVQFRAVRTGIHYVFAGIWARAPRTWLLVDDIRLDGPCGDNNAVPADP